MFKNRYKDIKAGSKFLSKRNGCVICDFFLRLEFVNSLVARVKADSIWALFRALKYEELELLVSTSKVDLPNSL